MEEGTFSWMFEECFPGMQYPTARDVPDTVSFILMSIDPNNSQFFWAALLHGNKVRCIANVYFQSLIIVSSAKICGYLVWTTLLFYT